MLCLTEKYHIIFSIKNLLSTRYELATKCRYENKYYLANYKTYHHKRLFKTIFPERLQNIFSINSITIRKGFSQYFL